MNINRYNKPVPLQTEICKSVKVNWYNKTSQKTKNNKQLYQKR